MFRPRLSGLTLIFCLSAPLAALAQYPLPPGELRGSGRDLYQPAQAVDAAGQMVRIDRLENQVRALTGQLEQLQFANKRLEDQLRKFQQDVEFRFQENGGRGAPAAKPPAAPAAPQGRRTEIPAEGVSPEEMPPLAPGPAIRLGRRGDAFDPDANPAAPGAPRQLGAPQQMASRAAPAVSVPLDEDEDIDLNAPVDLTRRNPRIPAPAPSTPGIQPQPQIAPQPASLPPPASPRDEFDRAIASLRGGRFEEAEIALRAFLQKYPKSSLAASATYSLGDSFLRRQRAREAAEQYLKVSTDFPKSPRAPDALVKLGQSLEKLGAKEQACAAYGEVGRKYPAANASVRASAERESQRAQC